MKKRVAVVAFVALMALGIASVVQALPPAYTGFDDVYYSDATFTTRVGERYMACYSTMTGWGALSDYKEGFEWDCETGHPIDDGCPSGLYVCDDYIPPGSYYGCECK
jgi:hypothetical protein